VNGIRIRILVMLKAKRIAKAVQRAANRFFGLIFAVESISIVRR